MTLPRSRRARAGACSVVGCARSRPRAAFDLIVRGGAGRSTARGQPPRRADVGVGRRSHHRDRRSGRRAGRPRHRCHGPGGGAGLHRRAGPVGHDAARRRQRRESPAPGHHERDHRRGRLAGILDAGHGGRASRSRRLGSTFDWTGFDGYFDKLRQRGTTINVGTFVPATMVRRTIVGMDNRPPTAGRADAHGSDGRSGDARRRVRVVERADLRARHRLRRPTSSWRSRRSRRSTRASTSRTFAARASTCSTRSTRRSASAATPGCRS